MSFTPVSMQSLLADVMGAKGLIGIPPPIALDALRKTAIDFCTQTAIWEYSDGFRMQANVSDYPLQVPEGTRVVNMKWAKINEHSCLFRMEEREVVWLTPAPQDNNHFATFCVALKPTQDACELPSILAEDWLDALTSGTAFRLFSIPKQEWSNGGLAMLNRKEYVQWIARARLTLTQNYKQSPLIMQGGYF